MPNDADVDRLATRVLNAVVVDLDAYRAQAEASTQKSMATPANGSAALPWFTILLALAVLLFLGFRFRG